MKEVEMFQLNENGKKLMGLLQKFRYSVADAKVLTYILDKKIVTSKKIERDMDLRQPEVSISIKKFRKRGIIDVAEIRKPGKGRPSFEYSLKISPDKIRKDIILQIEKKVAKQVSEMEELDLTMKKVIKS